MPEPRPSAAGAHRSAAIGSSRRARRAARACCPACAASIRPLRAGRRPRYAWVGVLAAMTALMPVAALDEHGRAPVAAAASAAAQEAAPATPPRRAPEPRRARPPAAAERIVWRDSLAVGSPNGGRLVNGVQLPAEGEGYYTYDPASQRPPGGEDRRWGTAALVREVVLLGRWWARTHPRAPRLGIGDLSRREGGPFHGPEVGHASHQNGLDVDIRLIRADGREAGVDATSYDRARTQAVVDRLVARGAGLVLIGPSLDLGGPGGVVMRWPNHDDHLHVRLVDPDGLGN
jgi:murein endopeptidase